VSLLRSGLLLLGESSALETLVTRTPLSAMSRRFVPGEGLDDLLPAVREANARGRTVTANYLGEDEKNRANCTAAGDVYLALMERIAQESLDAGLSLKFTQLGQEIGPSFLRENLERLLEKGREEGIFIRFDMESSEHTEQTLDAFEELWSEGWRRIGVVLQAYLHRTEDDVARMNELGAPVRLCKGAYAEPPEIAWQDREEVRRAFTRSVKRLLVEGSHPAIATHDERLIRETVRFAGAEGIGPDRFEFQMLYGVRRDLQDRLLDDGWAVRVYIPFGDAWYPYLMRRLAERPANLLFLAGSVVRESPLGVLWPGGDGRRVG